MSSSLIQCAVLLLVMVVNAASSYFINIDAHGEECFHDKVSAGTRMSLMFEVADGGFLDIDVKIIGPDQKVRYYGSF